MNFNTFDCRDVGSRVTCCRDNLVKSETIEHTHKYFFRCAEWQVNVPGHVARVSLELIGRFAAQPETAIIRRNQYSGSV
jgi:hypothetical protein